MKDCEEILAEVEEDLGGISTLIRTSSKGVVRPSLRRDAADARAAMESVDERIQRVLARIRRYRKGRR